MESKLDGWTDINKQLPDHGPQNLQLIQKIIAADLEMWYENHKQVICESTKLWLFHVNKITCTFFMSKQQSSIEIHQGNGVVQLQCSYSKQHQAFNYNTKL